MNMKKIILCSLLITGCSSTTPTVNSVLNETRTDYKKPLVCPELTTKVCNGPDKRTIDKYPRHYCKCLSRLDMDKTLENLMRN